MKQLYRCLSLAAVGVWLLLPANVASASSATDDRVVATYEGGEVTAGELVTFIRRTIKQVNLYDQPPLRRKGHLRHLIYLKYFFKVGVDYKIDKDPALQTSKLRYLLDHSGWLAQELIGEPAAQALTEADLRAYYDQHPEKFSRPTKFTFSFISFDTTDVVYAAPESNIEQGLDQVRQRAALASEALRSGSDFVDVVLEYCRLPPAEEDTGDSAEFMPESIGDTHGYKTVVEVHPEGAQPMEPVKRPVRPDIAKVLRTLEVDQVTDPVKLWNGFMVLILHERDEQDQKPFQEVQEKIRSILAEERRAEAIRELVQNTRRVAQIEKHYDLADLNSSATSDVLFSVVFFPKRLDYTVAHFRDSLTAVSPPGRPTNPKQTAEFLDGELERALIWVGLNLKGMTEEYRPDLMAENHWQEDVSRLGFYNYVNDIIRKWDPSDEEILQYWEENPEKYTVPASTRAEVLGATVAKQRGASRAKERTVRAYMERTLHTLSHSLVGKTGLGKTKQGLLNPAAEPRQKLERILELVQPDFFDLRVGYADSVILNEINLAGFSRKRREKLPALPPGEVLPLVMFRNVPATVRDRESDLEAVAVRVLEQIPERRLPLEEVRDRVITALRAEYRAEIKPELETHGYEPLSPKVNEDVLQSL